MKCFYVNGELAKKLRVGLIKLPWYHWILQFTKKQFFTFSGTIEVCFSFAPHSWPCSAPQDRRLGPTTGMPTLKLWTSGTVSVKSKIAMYMVTFNECSVKMVNFFPLTFLWIALMHAVCMGQWTDVDMKFGLRIHW